MNVSVYPSLPTLCTSFFLSPFPSLATNLHRQIIYLATFKSCVRLFNPCSAATTICSCPQSALGAQHLQFADSHIPEPYHLVNQLWIPKCLRGTCGGRAWTCCWLLIRCSRYSVAINKATNLLSRCPFGGHIGFQLDLTWPWLRVELHGGKPLALAERSLVGATNKNVWLPIIVAKSKWQSRRRRVSSC